MPSSVFARPKDGEKVNVVSAEKARALLDELRATTPPAL